MADIFRDFFKEVKPVRLREPLAQVLGAFKEKNAVIDYSFIDTVKMAGHACPTVAAAYVSCKKALEALYPQEIPQRGGITITVCGDSDEGVYGVMSQVFSFITGACPSTGFKGLGYKFKRKDLLKFEAGKIDPQVICFKFKRVETNEKVLLKIYPHKMPSLGEREQRMGELLEKVIWEAAKEKEVEEFQNLWTEKIKRIVLDEDMINEWLVLERKEA